MRNKKRMLAAGLISVAFLSTVTGCGSAYREQVEPHQTAAQQIIPRRQVYHSTQQQVLPQW